jgi:hypothetical protein
MIQQFKINYVAEGTMTKKKQNETSLALGMFKSSINLNGRMFINHEIL